MIVEEDQKVRLAVNRLGLSSLHPFKPRQEFHQFFPLFKNFSFYMIRRISAVVYNWLNSESIIEYRLATAKTGPLASLTLDKFILSVGARSSAPGGGSVAAVLAALVLVIASSWRHHFKCFTPFLLSVGLRSFQHDWPDDIWQAAIWKRWQHCSKPHTAIALGHGQSHTHDWCWHRRLQWLYGNNVSHAHERWTQMC